MTVREVIDKVEKYCIVIIPALYVIADVASGFIPALDNYIDEKGYLMVLSTLLVLIFLHFEKKDSNEFQFERSDKIVRDLENTLEKKTEYNDVYILAVTGYQYFKAFEESGAKVKNLRLLLRKGDDISTIDLPQNKDAKKEFMTSSIRMVGEWEKLHQKGQFTNLEIHYYDFDTTCHFMIADKKTLFWGLLYPKKEYPGTDVLTSYIVNNKSEFGEKMISDFFEKWNHILKFCD